MLTNKTGLPEPLYLALSRDDYSKGDADASVTELISPPQVAILSEAHKTEARVDVQDRFFSVLGTAMHSIIEKANLSPDTYVSEERLFYEIEGWTISGAVDLQEIIQDGVIIYDWKLLRAYKAKGGKIDEFEKQLNIYCYLIEQTKGVVVREAYVVALIRDWSQAEANKDPAYPQNPVHLIEVPLWPTQRQEDYLRSRIQLHKAARRSFEWGDPLPACTEAEMWADGSQWAVYKPGGKRAHRVVDTADMAQQIADAVSGVVSERPGKRLRCESYCSGSPWCEQWRKFRNAQG